MIYIFPNGRKKDDVNTLCADFRVGFFVCCAILLFLLRYFRKDFAYFVCVSFALRDVCAFYDNFFVACSKVLICWLMCHHFGRIFRFFHPEIEVRSEEKKQK